MDPFSSYEGAQVSPDLSGILQHLVHTIGFRYYWATEDLRQEDMSFCPAEDALSLEAQMAHIGRLLRWTTNVFRGDSAPLKDEIAPYLEMRRNTFETLTDLKKLLEEKGPDGIAAVDCFEKPYWHLLHGPLCDCLTHIGQINIYRRMLGKPARKVNHFLGNPVA